ANAVEGTGRLLEDQRQGPRRALPQGPRGGVEEHQVNGKPRGLIAEVAQDPHKPEAQARETANLARASGLCGSCLPGSFATFSAPVTSDTPPPSQRSASQQHGDLPLFLPNLEYSLLAPMGRRKGLASWDKPRHRWGLVASPRWWAPSSWCSSAAAPFTPRCW